jgi:hypothetical protein
LKNPKRAVDWISPLNTEAGHNKTAQVSTEKRQNSLQKKNLFTEDIEKVKQIPFERKKKI